MSVKYFGFWLSFRPTSLAKPYLEALHDIIDEEEGELEEDDDKEEAGQENREEQVNDDLYRKLIEDELSDSDEE